MKYDIAYMTRPRLTFDEVQILTPAGEGKMAGDYEWSPVTVAFINADEVFDHHRSGAGRYFDLEFSSPGERWTLSQCTLVSRSVLRPDEFVVSYLSALHHADD